MANRGKNEGTIFKKANGKWRAQVSINGKRLSLTANTRGECNDWLRKTLSQIDQGMTFEGRNLILAEYLKVWFAVKKNALRINTAFQYERLIQLYLIPGLGKVKLKDLSLRVVTSFYESLKNQGIGLSNIQYSHRVLHAALEQALKEGIIIRNPAHGATVPRSSYKEMQILNDQQVGLFLVAASASRFKILYQIAVTTGMRFSELRGLRWSDVDWVKGSIRVSRQIQDVPAKGSLSGSPKTHSGTRSILLGETSLNVLREQRVRLEEEKSNSCESWQDNDLIFPSSIGTPFSSSNLRKDFIQVLKAANLPRIRFHDLRHTAASLMLNHNVPALVVSKILGHSNPSVTLNIYAHSTLDMQSMAVSIMDEIIAPIPISISQLYPSAPDLHPIAPDQKR